MFGFSIKAAASYIPPPAGKALVHKVMSGRTSEMHAFGQTPPQSTPRSFWFCLLSMHDGTGLSALYNEKLPSKRSPPNTALKYINCLLVDQDIIVLYIVSK